LLLSAAAFQALYLFLSAQGIPLLPGVEGIEHNSQHSQEQAKQAQRDGEHHPGFAAPA
jgi:hypothetical protein